MVAKSMNVDLEHKKEKTYSSRDLHCFCNQAIL